MSPKILGLKLVEVLLAVPLHDKNNPIKYEP